MIVKLCFAARWSTMLFVINLLHVPAIIFFLGLATLFWSNQCHGKSVYQIIGEAFVRGLLCFYFIALMSPSIVAMTSGVATLVAGCCCYLSYRMSPVRGCGYGKLPLGGIVSAAVVILWFTMYVMKSPISTHDARSIWFFHSKIIYYSDKILDLSNWDHPSVYFSHVDYPKMLAALAASMCAAVGVSNEYLPKLALVLLAIPIVFLSIDLGKTLPKSILCLMFLWIFPGGLDMWDGYMDGSLASYAGLASIYGGRYVATGKSSHLYTALLCTAMCTCLKNEGFLFAVLCCVAVVFSRLLMIKRKGSTVRPLKVSAAYVLPFVPTALWTGWAKWHHLSNDLLSAGHLLDRLLTRIRCAETWHVLGTYLLNRHLVRQVIAVAFLIMLARFCHTSKVKGLIAAGPAAGVFVFYYLAIMIIYLTSYHDLISHLDSSADRVILLPLVQLLAGTFVLVACGSEPLTEDR